MLVRLMYASRAAPGMDQEELNAILHHAKQANVRHGISGVLCLADGVFLQVLEGGRGAVNRLYGLIQGDPRHSSLELLGYEEVGERRFCSWAMGQVNLGRLNRALLMKYSESGTLDPFATPGRVSLALFEDLVASASIGTPP